MRASLVVVLSCLPLAEAAAAGQSRDGETLYRTACAACHGPDGTGMPKSVVGFDVPLPDFTDCSFATREPDADWLAVTHQGGPARAFDPWMPAFGDALPDDDLLRILGHVRTFCADRAWPRGELNLPRALVTEKAYPEDEVVFSAAIASGDPGTVGTELVYERRFGPRSQIELLVPVELAQEPAGGPWRRGLGDLAIAFKHALFHRLDRGTILSGAAEVIFPTGKESEGLGKGVTIVEPFVAFGQLLPADSFLQLQAGLELPSDTARAGREAFWRATIGTSVSEARFGRTWSPMVELLAARELESGARAQWDALPQLQVTLSRRQHVMLNVGARVPVSQRSGRRTQLLAYLLWDWFDGGFFDGWR